MKVTWLEIKIVGWAIGVLSGLVGTLIFIMHKQAMEKMDALIKTVGEIGKQLVSHDEKLRAGTREFQRIEDHQKEQDKQIKSHGERIAVLETRTH